MHLSPVVKPAGALLATFSHVVIPVPRGPHFSRVTAVSLRHRSVASSFFITTTLRRTVEGGTAPVYF